MPHKFNEDRRHKIPKQKFKVTNWPAYNESLRRRGDLTVWISDDALSQWAAPRRTSRGVQPKYSDMAITTCLTLRVVYDQPLRQTQGMMRSIARLIGVEISVPDFSTLSRRGKGLELPPVRRPTASQRPVHLVIDSTGLEVFGEGEWLENKHKVKVKRKRWRKLPPKTAVQSPQSAHNPTVRDCHIAEIETEGWMAWQKSTGNNQRSRVESQIGRWKIVIGPKLRARNLDNQVTEAKIGVRTLNQMTELRRPEFVRVA